MAVRDGLGSAPSFFARAVGACKVGSATGAGGPVFVLAVLALAAAWVTRGMWATRQVADDSVRELLYAWDVIAPG